MGAGVFCSKGALQELDGTVGSLDLKPWSNSAEAFRDMRGTLMGGNEPLISGQVAHSRLAISIIPILRPIDRGGACCERLLVHGISVFHIQVEPGWIWLIYLCLPTATKHQHGIA